MLAHVLLALLVPQLGARVVRVTSAETQPTAARGVRIDARFEWPQAMQRGYFPLALEVRNEADEPRRVELEARPQWGSSDRFVERFTVPPGAVEPRELLLRARVDGSNTYIVDVTIDGHEAEPLMLGAGEWRSTGKRSLLVAVPPGGATADADGWQRALGAGGHSVGVVRFGSLSASFEAYTSLDGVLVDVSAGLPDEARWEALTTWARLGGGLLLYGEGASERARADARLAPWLEDRFVVTARAGGTVHAMGQGRLVLIDAAAQTEGDPFAPRTIDLVREELGDARAREDWVPRHSGSRARESSFVDKPYADLPLRALTALLVLFAILIGPVNFVLVRRSGRPTLLLLTVPGIALAASLALLAYGVFQQGLGVDVVRETWTLLDQRGARAAAVEVRELFAGSSPGAGLRPGPGTAVFVDEQGRGSGIDRFQSYRADYTDGVLLSGAYLPVRDPVRHVTLTDRTARRRVELRRDDEGVELANALGADVLGLVLHDVDDRWYRSAERVPDGVEARLVEIDPEAGREDTERLEEVLLGLDARGLPRGTYAAELVGDPFVDDCGVAVTEVAGRHHVLGVLPDGEGAR